MPETQPPSPPRSAYLHVPFCRHRCGYCNFSVIAGREDLEDDFLRAIALELFKSRTPPAGRDALPRGRHSHTMSVERLDEMLGLARRWFPPIGGRDYTEWTVEANPEDSGPTTIGRLAEHGATRLSLGVQSLDAGKLSRLERAHTADEVAAAVEAGRTAGMQVSIDLIFAAPGETLELWTSDLDRAIELEPDHVSVYGLTYELGTRFWSRRMHGGLIEADEELQRDMYLAAIDRLSAAGYEHYEVSNFARPGRRSQHNEAYWAGREYFAAGPGASRYVNGVRETNHRSTTTYLKCILAGASPVAEREMLDPERRARERLVFSLRRLEGVSRKAFDRAAGFSIDRLAGPAIARLVALGVLVDDGDRLRLSREGLLVSDAIWPELL